MSLKEMNTKEKLIFGLEVGIAVLDVQKKLLQPPKLDSNIISNSNSRPCTVLSRGVSSERMDDLMGHLSDSSDIEVSRIKQSMLYNKKKYSERRLK